MPIYVKNAKEVQAMRVAGQMAADTLLLVGDLICEGMSTDDVNRIVHEDTLKKGGIPAPLGYTGSGKTPFPKSCCTSVNNVVCHGIPSPFEKLKKGDIINVDITTIFNGWHGDTSATFFIGDVSPEARALVEHTRTAMNLGISQVKHGARLGDIGSAIQEYSEKNGYAVVKGYVGHGIGKGFHEEPQVCHFGTRGAGTRIITGMIFTVEPMLNLGSEDTGLDPKDNWTVKTVDGKLSVQFEHTVLCTPTGYEILTARSRPLKNSEI